MTDTPTPPPQAPQRWLGPGVVALLALQLGLLWIQGVQLNRQHHDLVDLRGDLQSLAESLDQSQAPDSEEEAQPYVPGRHHAEVRPRWRRVRQESKPEAKPEGEQDPALQGAQKDLKDAQDSAQKAVKDARKAQSQLSLSENARKAEEKAKVQEARASWEIWAGLAAVVVIGALLVRGWLRAREE